VQSQGGTILHDGLFFSSFRLASLFFCAVYSCVVVVIIIVDIVVVVIVVVVACVCGQTYVNISFFFSKAR